MTALLFVRDTGRDCGISWRGPDDAQRMEVVTLPELVWSAASRHARQRRQNAFIAGYRGQREGTPRRANPHQASTGGWSRMLERCWFAGWDLASTISLH